LTIGASSVILSTLYRFRNRKDVGTGFWWCQYVNVAIPTSFLYGHAGIREKRVLSEPAEDIFNRLKRAKIVTNAPSETAKPTLYEDIQGEPSERILDDRPEPDLDIPPVSLLYKGFGHFLDIVDGRDDVLGLADVDVWRLREKWMTLRPG